MIYFKDCRTIEEVKAMYKLLAKQHHPDCGGDTATMQQVNAEYAFVCAKILKGENLSAEDTDEQIRMSEEYRQVIEQIINLPGIEIEIVGMWIWVTGDTKPVKQQLKDAGFFFASKKVAWYYRSEEFRTKGGKKTLDEIREKYGSEKVHSRRHTNAIQ
jgi:curved DNA-binding protein CbpA